MAKDRNTVAKRQREVEKKRKADQKRERRAKKKQSSQEALDSGNSPAFLSSAERGVLDVFRKYLMTPGKMLCFGNSDLDSFSEPLAQLITKGLLVREASPGGYSLTETGFARIKDGN